MTIDGRAWDTVTKELVLMGHILEDPDTEQAFYDAATKQHALFHVARTFIDTGRIVKLHEVVCECENPLP